MDLSRHGLKRRPFRTAPDLELFQPTATHTRAVQAWTNAYEARDALVLLDGDSGLGKTISALKFLQQLPADVVRFYLPSCRFAGPLEFFQSILFDAELPYRGLTEHEARLAVVERVIRGQASNAPVAFVLDEAHHLSDDLLEEIRLLSNYSGREGALVFFGLVALPSLRTRLDKAGWSSTFGRRLALRVRLEPLDADESSEFLRSQLLTAGRKRADLLTDEALELAAVAAVGVPRALNQLATAAWAIAEEAGESQIDAEAMMAAMMQMGLTAEEANDALPMKSVPKLHATVKLAIPADVPDAERRTERAKPRRKAS